MHRTEIPAPFGDENCYSILCRYAVRSGRHSTNRVCRELFGHVGSLKGYLFKPFRLADIRRWENGKPGKIRYGADHSCWQYFSAFMGYEDAGLLKGCVSGSVLTPGQEKRISTRGGFSQTHKKQLWYCPECVREDIRRFGETCWRRLPQIPGVSYCTVHQLRLAQSGLKTTETRYRLCPATYVLDSFPEPGEYRPGNVFETEFLQLARDTEWLLQHGFGVGGLEMLREGYRNRTGKRLQEWLLSPAKTGTRKTFENYLYGRVLKECGTERVDPRTQRFLSMIISIEKDFGSIEAFCAEDAGMLMEE